MPIEEAFSFTLSSPPPLRWACQTQRTSLHFAIGSYICNVKLKKPPRNTKIKLEPNIPGHNLASLSYLLCSRNPSCRCSQGFPPQGKVHGSCPLHWLPTPYASHAPMPHQALFCSPPNASLGRRAKLFFHRLLLWEASSLVNAPFTHCLTSAVLRAFTLPPVITVDWTVECILCIHWWANGCSSLSSQSVVCSGNWQRTTHNSSGQGNRHITLLWWCHKVIGLEKWNTFSHSIPPLLFRWTGLAVQWLSACQSWRGLASR